MKKEKLMQVRMDAEVMEYLDYLIDIRGYKNYSDAIRRCIKSCYYTFHREENKRKAYVGQLVCPYSAKGSDALVIRTYVKDGKEMVDVIDKNGARTYPLALVYPLVKVYEIDDKMFVPIREELGIPQFYKEYLKPGE